MATPLGNLLWILGKLPSVHKKLHNVQVSPTALDKLCIFLKWLQIWTNPSGEILHRSRCFFDAVHVLKFSALNNDHER
ncbi:hypothetical protein TNIN_394001 [Trichonephila inaurata madagascariensis]|uniref:Uncharacterized protein n=1 Tax=Trichonephila inaurata madagascariensis TaxID=2747483 RepID=A0A8X6Y4S9_9ARAC|nr:hypothetical protein TNIN_394001 [Trichonephila inaurata madagascariensis]